MKKAISIIIQLLLFLLVFGAFSLFPPFHIEHVLGAAPSGTRIFIIDGLLLTLAVYLLIVLVEFLRKRLRTAGPLTTVAFIFAIILGLLMKFGFLTRSTF